MRTLALVIGPIPLLTMLGYLTARDFGLRVGLAVGALSSLFLTVFFGTIYAFDVSALFGLFALVCLLPLTVAGLQFAARSSDSVMPAAVVAQLLATAGAAALIRIVWRRRGRNPA